MIEIQSPSLLPSHLTPELHLLAGQDQATDELFVPVKMSLKD